MYLFIWTNVLWDYGSGVIFAVAETKEKAIAKIKKTYPDDQAYYAVLNAPDKDITKIKVTSSKACGYLNGSS